MRRKNTTPGAVGLAFVGYTCWVLADAGLKIAGKAAFPISEVLALVGISVMVVLFAYALLRNALPSLWPKDPLRQFLRSCLDLGNNIGVVIALRHLPLALFYILIFSAPLVATLLAAVFLGEALEWRKTLAILVGFVGVVVAVNPFGLSRSGDWTGYLACAGCVLAFSVNLVWSRVMTQTESAESLTFFSGGLMAVAGGFAMMRHASPLTGELTITLGAVAGFGVLGSLCFFAALRRAPTAIVAQCHYSQLVTGSLVAYLLWHDRLAFTMIIGAALIIASGSYAAAASYHELGDA